MTDPEYTQKEAQPQEIEKTTQQPEKNLSEMRNERLDQINQDLEIINQQTSSPEEIQKNQEQREKEYQDKVEELENNLETKLKEESTNLIHKNMVEDNIRQEQMDNEKLDALQKEKIKLETISAKVKGMMNDNPNLSEEDATKYATEETEKGIVHKPVTIEGNPEEVKARQEEYKRILETGETEEQLIDSERGKELTTAIQNVASIFNKMGVQWKLDGALNISLRDIEAGKNAYFRMHRDIDVHVMGDIDGEELHKLLEETKFEESPYGYGAFVNDESLNNPELVKKRGHLMTEFNKGKTPEQGLRFFRLDENGNPHFKIGEIVIDVHCSKDKLKSITGQELPKEWQTPTEKVDLNGESISLDHTNSVLYHKLIIGRDRDFIDIDFMVDNNQINSKNADEVRDVILKDLESEQLHADQKEALQKSLKKLDEIENKLT